MAKHVNPTYSEKREIECQTELDDGYFIDDGPVQEEDVQESLYGLLQLTRGDENDQTCLEGSNLQPIVETLTSVPSSIKKDFTITSKKLFRSTKVITPSKFATLPVDESKWETLSKDYSKKASKAKERRKKPIAKKSKELLYEILTTTYGSLPNENAAIYQCAGSGETNLKTATQIPMQFLSNSQYRLVTIQHPIDGSDQVLQLPVADVPNSSILTNQVVQENQVALTINSVIDENNQMPPIYEIPKTEKQDISMGPPQDNSFSVQKHTIDGSYQNFPTMQMDTENIQPNLNIVQSGANAINSMLHQKLSTEQGNVFITDDKQHKFMQTDTILNSDVQLKHPLIENTDSKFSNENQNASLNQDVQGNVPKIETEDTCISYTADLHENLTICDNSQKSGFQNDVFSADNVSTNVDRINSDILTRKHEINKLANINTDNRNEKKYETTTLNVEKLQETLQNQGRDLLAGLINNEKGEVYVNGTPLKLIFIDAAKAGNLRNVVTTVRKDTDLETSTDGHVKNQHVEKSIIVNRISKTELDKQESSVVVTMVTKQHENDATTKDCKVLQKSVKIPKFKPDQLSPNDYYEMIKKANKTKRFQDGENVLKSDKPRKYQCDMCAASFTKSCNLSAHKRIHANDKRFQCDICHQRFYVASKLRIHYTVHTSSRPFECDVCHKKFRQKSVLKNHMLIHGGKKQFCCEICDKAFHRRNKLDTHLKTHNPEKPFKCEYCEKTFAIIYYYRRHVKRHAAEKEFKCDICLKTFHLKESYKFHLMTHNESEKKQCNICLKTFIKESQLRQHVCKGQGGEIDQSEYSCDKCDKVFYTKAQLKIHVKQQHDKEAVHKCEICGKLFLHEYLLKRHKVVHSNKKPYYCKLCKAEFGWASSIRSHILKMHKDVVGSQDKFIEIEKSTENNKTEKAETVKIEKVNDSNSVICKICNEVIKKVDFDSHMKLHVNCSFMCCFCLEMFEQEKNLKQHLEVHQTSEQENSCKIQCKICMKEVKEPESAHHALKHMESVFICRICYKVYDDREILQYHEKTHEKCEKDVPTFTCDICKKLLPESEHEKHKSLHIRYPYTCQFCFMNFEKETFLLNHLEIHKGDKPHRCNLCGDKFATLQALGKHREIHKTEEAKPKVCNTCGKRFRHLGDLQMHQRVHTGERPFKCENCFETFARKDNLKKHVLKFHKTGEKLQCDKCPKQFSIEADLRRHKLCSHVKEKPFACHLCDRSFVHNYELIKHTLSIHEEKKPFKCSICGESFSKRKTWNNHIKKKHPMVEKQSDIINKFVMYEEIENKDEMDDDNETYMSRTIKQEVNSKKNTDVPIETDEQNSTNGQMDVGVTMVTSGEEPMEMNEGENKTFTGPVFGIEETVVENSTENISTYICESNFESESEIHVEGTEITSVVQNKINIVDCEIINLPGPRVNDVKEIVCQTDQNCSEVQTRKEITESVHQNDQTRSESLAERNIKYECQTSQNHSESLMGEETTEKVCKIDQNLSESLAGEEIIKLDNEMYISDPIKEPETENIVSIPSNSTSVPIEIHIQIMNKSSESPDNSVAHRILNIQADPSALPTWYLDEDSGKIIKLKKSETADNMIDIEIMDKNDVHMVIADEPT